jgi:hypothetical protein
LAGTVDTRTNDITTAAEWSNRQGVVRVAYDGSLFANATDTLVWDNPLRITDQTHPSASAGNGSSQGRLPLWPDSSAHTVSGSGSVNLPAPQPWDGLPLARDLAAGRATAAAHHQHRHPAHSAAAHDGRG